MKNENTFPSDERPTLETARLILRPFELSDAKNVQRLAGHKLVAQTTATVPHPYHDGMAEAWISTHGELFATGKGVQFAMVPKSNSELVGCISLFDLAEVHRRAEMGYWVGVEFWGKGYCTEAAYEVLRYGFEVLNLNKVEACHMDINPASGQVMKKIGMKQEDRLRQDRWKDGRFVDIDLYGILQIEFLKSESTRQETGPGT